MEQEGLPGAVNSLAESGEELRVALSAAGVGVLDADAQSRRVRCSADAARLLGWPEREAEYGFDEFLARVHPGDRDAVVDAVRFAGRPDAPPHPSLEARFVPRPGEVRWLTVQGRVLRDAQGVARRLVGIVYDVTRRKEVELALQRSEAQLRKAQRLAHLGSYEVRAEFAGDDVWSEEVYRILGLDPAKGAISREQFIAEFVAPADRERVAALIEEGIESGRPFDMDYRLVRPDGAVRQVRSVTQPLRDASGRVATLVGTLQDLTEVRELEEQVLQLQKLEAIGRLAGGVAHDFNNLLTVISTYCELALGSLAPDEPAYEMVRCIQTSGRRAAELTQQLLTFSRRSVISPVVLDLNRLLSEREDVLRRLIGEDVALRVALAREPCPVRADPTQVEQVLLNLVLNARDAIASVGTIAIETRIVPGPTGARDVRLSVRDDGVGMDESVKARVFEPFFTTKEVGRGTGLGLPVVFGIVQQSGGRIEVDSAPGRGSSFHVFLPHCDPRGLRAGVETPPGPMPRGSETVLLVEDEQAVLSLACAALESAGYRVLRADGSRSALFLAERMSEPIDLLITDVVMPEIGGRELADELRRGRPELRVLYVSGYTDEMLLRRGIHRAEATFLQKPFTASALARKVREVLAKGEDGGA